MSQKYITFAKNYLFLHASHEKLALLQEGQFEPIFFSVWNKCHDDDDEDDYPWLIYLANPQLVRVRIDEHPPATLLPALKPL